MRQDHQKNRGILIIGILVVSLLAGCGAPAAATPAPTPEALRVAVSPSLQPMQEALHQCALDQPEIALIVDEIPPASPDFSRFALEIRLGMPPGGASYAAALAEEKIAVIIHPDNPVRSLTSEQVRALFSGRVRSWSDVGGTNQEVQPWVAPSGDEIRQIFDAAVLAGEPVSTQAFLAPDPTAMLSGVASSTNAIGYLPEAWLTDTIRTVSLENSLENPLRKPVLALAAQEPAGSARIFLHCLQNGAGQRVIQDHYRPWKANDH